MRVVHCAAECSPFAKIGGIGDVVSGLAKEQSKHHSVTILLPKYASLSDHFLDRSQQSLSHDTILYQGRILPVCLTEVDYGKIHYVYVEIPEFFSSSLIYGYGDDVTRFIAFCIASWQFLRRYTYDLLHLHDWHTGLLASLIHSIPTLLTIHNFAYLGIFSSPEYLYDFGCNKEVVDACDLHNQCYSLLHAGIKDARKIVTVSLEYAKELLENPSTPLYPVLQERKCDFTGIMNGLDNAVWTPSHDPCIHPYSIEECREKYPFILGKQLNKKKLQNLLGLEERDCLLMGMVSRIVEQKNPCMMLEALHAILQKGGQCVLLGHVLPNEAYASLFYEEQAIFNPNRAILLRHDEMLAHLIFAASDLFFVPSVFEPCGLTQMIAMRYGSVPWVSPVGGLKESVNDTMGFVLKNLESLSMRDQLDEIMQAWNTPSVWASKIRHSMQRECSWAYGERLYDALYREALY